jgi:hypothetical protein
MTERRRLPNRRAGIGRFPNRRISIPIRLPVVAQASDAPFYASNWISLGDAAAMVMKRLQRSRRQWARR